MDTHETTPTATHEVVEVTIGQLVDGDIAAARSIHDAIATDSEDTLRAAGSASYMALLSTTLMSGTSGSFIGIERRSPSSPQGEVASLSAALADAGAGLFAPAPTIERYHRRDDWFGFGELPVAAASTDSWIAVVHGRLAGDAASARAAHDAAASAGAPVMREMGDIAHLPFTGVDDPAQFMSIDVWHNIEHLETMYTNPDVADGFMSLFSAPPTFVVYRTSDWHQW